MPELPTGTVTFLFSDIEGNTPLWERDPMQMDASIQIHHAVLRQAIEGNGGNVFKIIGDEFQAAFPTAPQALRAALQAQRGLQGASWNELGPLRARMGMHTGEAHPDEQGDEYVVSHTKNRGHRVMEAGHGGQILLSLESADLCQRDLPEGVYLKDLGEHHIRNWKLPEHFYQVVAPDLPKDFPPLRTQLEPKHNLPVQLTSFVGREKEIEEIKDLFQQYRLVTLSGPGGTGKTRLALRVASRLLGSYPDGVWLVELAPIVDPDLVTQTAANALGMHLSTGPQTLSFLEDYLQSKCLLLILDNCEHLIEACARLVDALLHTCPHLHILASSREALGIDGEASFRVPPLAFPKTDELLENLAQYEAMRLFAERAGAALPDFEVTAENAPSIVQVCRRLDGIPLAIELAAARVKVLSVEQINSRLSDRFRLLTGGSRAALPRYQTLRASIDWSYDLLSLAEKALLQRLSIFAGSWTLEAAEHVGCGEGLDSCAVLDLLGGLVNKSLVAFEAEVKAERRYRMLETIRQYAHEKLVADGQANEARNQHLQYYTVLAERVEDKIRGPNMAAILKQLEVELDNIRLALDWSLEARDTTSRSLESGLRLIYAFWMFIHYRAHHSEAARWLDRLLALEVEERGNGVMSPERMKLRAQALLEAGNMVLMMGKVKQATEWLEEGRSLFEQLGPDGGLGYAWALYHLGAVAMVQSDVIRAEKLFKQSLANFRELHDLFGVYQNLLSLGFNEIARQDYEQARRYFEEDLAVTKEIGYLDGVGAALWGLGEVAFLQNDPEKARQLFDESQVIFRQVDDTWGLCSVLLFLGQLDWEAGNYPDTLRYFDQVLSLGRQQGDVSFISYALSNLGRLALSQGDWDQAENWFSENLAFNRRNDTRDYIALSLFDLGNLAFEEDNLEKAANLYDQARGICQEMDTQSGRAATLYGLGRVALVRGDYQLAGPYLLESLSMQPYSGEGWFGTLTGPWSAFDTLETLAFWAGSQQQYDLAARLLAATESWITRVKRTHTPREREMRELALAEVRAALGEKAFAAAWEEGRAMTLDQAIAYAKDK